MHDSIWGRIWYKTEFLMPGGCASIEARLYLLDISLNSLSHLECHPVTIICQYLSLQLPLFVHIWAFSCHYFSGLESPFGTFRPCLTVESPQFFHFWVFCCHYLSVFESLLATFCLYSSNLFSLLLMMKTIITFVKGSDIVTKTNQCFQPFVRVNTLTKERYKDILTLYVIMGYNSLRIVSKPSPYDIIFLQLTCLLPWVSNKDKSRPLVTKS